MIKLRMIRRLKCGRMLVRKLRPLRYNSRSDWCSKHCGMSFCEGKCIIRVDGLKTNEMDFDDDYSTYASWNDDY